MNRLVFLILWMPCVAIGQTKPVVFKVVGEQQETELLAESDSLDRLTMGGNVRRTGLRADQIGKWDLYIDKDSDQALIFKNKNKKRLPMKYRDFVYYPKINLSGNKISTLKFHKIGCDTDTLILRNCKIEQVSIAPKKMKWMRYPSAWKATVVDLNGNLISTMEEAMLVSPKMKILDLRENRIEELTDTKQLEELYLARNQIKSIDNQCVKKGSPLRILDLSQNKLQHLPRCFKHAHELEDLDLSGNEFSRLNVNFSRHENLRVVNLKGNPMTSDYVNELRAKWTHIEFLF